MPSNVSPRETVGGAMARTLTSQAKRNAQFVEDLPFNTFNAVSGPALPGGVRRQRIDPEVYVTEVFGKAARPFSGGQHGQTFVLTVTDALAKLRKQYLYETLALSMPPVGSKVLLKVSPRKKYETIKQFVAETRREAAAHVHLYKHPPVQVRGSGCTMTLASSAFTPRFYFFGIDAEYDIALTVMEFIAEAVPLKSMKRISSTVFQGVELALASSLAVGVEHGDLHFNNVLVQGRARVWLIDFGFAVRLQEKDRLKIIEFFGLPGSALSLNTASKLFALPTTNAVQYKRSNGQLTFYNPTHRSFRVLWSRLSNDARANLRATEHSKSLSCVYGV